MLPCSREECNRHYSVPISRTLPCVRQQKIRKLPTGTHAAPAGDEDNFRRTSKVQGAYIWHYFEGGGWEENSILVLTGSEEFRNFKKPARTIGSHGRLQEWVSSSTSTAIQFGLVSRIAVDWSSVLSSLALLLACLHERPCLLRLERAVWREEAATIATTASHC